MSVQISIGAVYRVEHYRKGTFTMRIIAQDGEWLTGQIMQGQAKALLDFNRRDKGEEITVRRDFCKLSKIMERVA